LRKGGFDEVLAEVPKGAREFAEIAQNIVEGGDKTVDLLFPNDEGRKDLDDIGVVSGHLSEDPMFLEERSNDHLREKALVHGMDGFPSEFELKRAGFLEFDSDHQAFASDFGDDVVFFLEIAEAGHELFAAKSGVFNEVLVFGHVEAGQSASHGEIVATESGGVSDATIEPGENALVNGATHDDGGARDVATGKGFGHGDDIGIEVPVLETEPFTCSTHGSLDLVGDEKSAVFLAKCLGGGEVVVVRIFHALALDRFKDEGGDVFGAEFLFKVLEVTEFDEVGPREEGTKVFAEISRVGDGESSIG